MSSGAGWQLDIRSHSAADTRRLAGALAAACRPGDVVLVAGELGAGKTTFAQGFAAGLGITQPVTSPTFTLLHDYPCPRPVRGIERLLHADLYRLDSFEEVFDLSLHELVEDGAVAVVEWGDRAPAAFGASTLTVHLERPVQGSGPPIDTAEERVVRLVADGDPWAGRRSEVSALLDGAG